MMENRPDLKFRRIHENVSCHFDFLLRRGFCIVSATFAGQGTDSWQVTLMDGDWLIRVQSHQGRINLALNTVQLYDELGLFDLDFLVQHLGGGDGFFYRPAENRINEMQQLKRTAWLLQKYIDGILAHFERNSFLILNRLAFSHSIQQNRTTV